MPRCQAGGLPGSRKRSGFFYFSISVAAGGQGNSHLTPWGHSPCVGPRPAGAVGGRVLGCERVPNEEAISRLILMNEWQISVESMGTSGNVSFTKDFSTFLKTIIFEDPQQWFSFYMPGLTAGTIVLPMVLKVLTVESLTVSPVVFILHAWSDSGNNCFTNGF